MEGKEESVLRVGVIGTGIFAIQAHYPALKQLEDKFQIVACANRSEEKALKYAELAGISKDRVFTDYNQLLELQDVDAVVIALPVEFNYTVGRAALIKGKHVLMEKPIAHNLEDAQKILGMLQEFPSQVFMIAENYPYKESVQATSALVSSGILGDIITFSLVVVRKFDSSKNPYLATSWRQNPSHVGGYLSDGGVHWASLLHSALGPIASVSAFSRQIEPLNGTDDSIAMNLKLKSGAIGTWNMTFAAGSSGFANFTIVGRKGTLVLKDLNSLTVTNENGEIVHSENFVEDSGPTVSAKKDIVEEFKDFHATVQRRKKQNEELKTEEAADFVLVHKTQPKVSPEETFHHFAMIVAALQSVSSKKVEDVALPLSS